MVKEAIAEKGSAGCVLSGVARASELDAAPKSQLFLQVWMSLIIPKEKFSFPTARLKNLPMLIQQPESPEAGSKRSVYFSFALGCAR